MRLPWISRKKHRAARRKWIAEAKAAIALAEARVDELRKQFERSELERTDLQMKLLRVGFGVNPFAEMFASDAPMQQSVAEEAARPIEEVVPPGLSDEEVQATFIREAQGKFGNSLREIQRHVEERQAEYYQFRRRQSLVSAAEMTAAQSVAQDLENDIAEGRAAAAAIALQKLGTKG